MLKPYRVHIRQGVEATFMYDDETAKRLGYLKDDKKQGTATSASKESGTVEAKEAQTPLNKELTSPQNKALTPAEKRAATLAAKKAANKVDKD